MAAACLRILNGQPRIGVGSRRFMRRFETVGLTIPMSLTALADEVIE